MKHAWITFLLLSWGVTTLGLAQVPVDEAKPKVSWALDPAVVGFRLDDNVYRSVTDGSRMADGIGSAEWGAQGLLTYQLFRGLLNDHFGDDQYTTYTDLNNFKNDLNLLLAVEPGDWNFYYKFDYFLRASQYFDFNYFDINSVIGTKWTPKGLWNYELQYKNLARQYFDKSPDIWSRNFVDQSGVLSIQREVDDRLTVKASGSYTNRQFNRYAVSYNGTTVTSLGSLQNDNTWKILLNAHLYFFSMLQDINFEEQRTNSNSYGFSNSVQSVSWAGVIRPAGNFYFQLLFRLYLKTYDQNPLTLPDLQLGFIDEDSQDLLAAKANWDMGSGWVSSLGVSRIRSESDQPGAYYVKDMVSAQIRKSF